jgi:hypothetical protein
MLSETLLSNHAFGGANYAALSATFNEYAPQFAANLVAQGLPAGVAPIVVMAINFSNDFTGADNQALIDTLIGNYNNAVAYFRGLGYKIVAVSPIRANALLSRPNALAAYENFLRTTADHDALLDLSGMVVGSDPHMLQAGHTAAAPLLEAAIRQAELSGGGPEGSNWPRGLIRGDGRVLRVAR